MQRAGQPVRGDAMYVIDHSLYVLNIPAIRELELDLIGEHAADYRPEQPTADYFRRILS